MLFSFFGSLREDVFFAKPGDLYDWFELLSEWLCTAQGIPVIKGSFPANVTDHPPGADAGRQELTLVLENVVSEEPE